VMMHKDQTHMKSNCFSIGIISSKLPSGCYTAPGPLAHRTLSGAHRIVRCLLPTVGAATRHPQISQPTVGAGDRWLTEQSGEL
jgi:hypothetical protein